MANVRALPAFAGTGGVWGTRAGHALAPQAPRATAARLASNKGCECMLVQPLHAWGSSTRSSRGLSPPVNHASSSAAERSPAPNAKEPGVPEAHACAVEAARRGRGAAGAPTIAVTWPRARPRPAHAEGRGFCGRERAWDWPGCASWDTERARCSRVRLSARVLRRRLLDGDLERGVRAVEPAVSAALP